MNALRFVALRRPIVATSRICSQHSPNSLRWTSSSTSTSTPSASTPEANSPLDAGRQLEDSSLSEGPTALPAAPSLVHAPGSLTPPQPVSPLRPIVDSKSIRNAPEIYAANCMARNYGKCGSYPARIASLHHMRLSMRAALMNLRTRARRFQDDMRGLTQEQRAEIAPHAQEAKKKLADHLKNEREIDSEIERLTLALPNLTSDETPRSSPRLIDYINAPAVGDVDPLASMSRSHVDIGAELGILDFASSAITSGWGFYYLLGAGAQLEQALVQYATQTAMAAGWTLVSVPTIVYSHIGSACGFQPRDTNDEQQVYSIEQHMAPKQIAAHEKAFAEGREPPKRPQHVLAGTAEIPLAGMHADSTLPLDQLPLRHVASSRSYRAEAGARGQDTKGLYRVHEFTKVELFAWTKPEMAASVAVFDEMVDLQRRILGALGLRCRVLEMPATDLGASAARKIDIEALFPSRRELAKSEGGWGELSSASICTDYQTRRLRTRVKAENGTVTFPHTVNGTALAVPRVIAAILETHWNEATRAVAIPEVLQPYMGGKMWIEAEKKE
ncbi:Serine--tRNA ligase, mitochondrial [Ceratocystis pirilliformis]|uniref:serine--tRNA ligase n=1 Tax=Ceratocystis pirilliformis TaxID=259994 RepID=A0ABR3ZAE3_9PEZI